MFQSPTESTDKLLSTIRKGKTTYIKLNYYRLRISTIRKTHHTTFCSITAQFYYCPAITSYRNNIFFGLPLPLKNHSKVEVS